MEVWRIGATAPRGTRDTSSRARRARLAATLLRDRPRIRTRRLARTLYSSRRRTPRGPRQARTEAKMACTLPALQVTATCRATCGWPSPGSTSSSLRSLRRSPHHLQMGLGARRSSLPTRCERVAAWRSSGSCGAPCMSRHPRRCVDSRPRLSGLHAETSSRAMAFGAARRRRSSRIRSVDARACHRPPWLASSSSLCKRKWTRLGLARREARTRRRWGRSRTWLGRVPMVTPRATTGTRCTGTSGGYPKR